MALTPLTLDDYFKGRDIQYADELTDEIKANAVETVKRLNALQIAVQRQLAITSGWRPPSITYTIPGAKHGDAHEKGQGADLHDPKADLYYWLVRNVSCLISIGLWLESISSAKNHIHVQTYAPRSGNRIFFA